MALMPTGYWAGDLRTVGLELRSERLPGVDDDVEEDAARRAGPASSAGG
jgi:hypothetical protein